MVITGSPVAAQSSLSEHLAATILHARNNDLHRRFGRALIDYGHDLEIDPGAGVGDARQTLLRRAALYEAVKEFAKAEAELTAAVQLSPTAELHAARAYYYMRRGRFADALSDFLDGARIAPDNARLRFGAGRVQAALGNYAAAVGFYDQAIRLGRREPTFYLARAEARIHLELPRSAWADYDQALEIKLPRASDRYYAFLGRGYASLLLADYAGAIADFDNALALDPQAINALLWRGYAREQGGQASLALDDYERAITVDPNDRWARANLQRLRSN
jgi:tetratricopeptide (TPR) repeat protein